VKEVLSGFTLNVSATFSRTLRDEKIFVSFNYFFCPNISRNIFMSIFFTYAIKKNKKIFHAEIIFITRL